MNDSYLSIGTNIGDKRSNLKLCIEKISKFGKSYKELTNDTVKTFYKDALDANFVL